MMRRIRKITCLCFAIILGSYFLAEYSSAYAAEIPKADVSVVETNGSAGGFSTASLRVKSNGYVFTCENYLGETSAFDMSLFGWPSEKNTLSVFILDDDSAIALDAEISFNEKVNGKQFNNVQVSSFNKYTNETYRRFFNSTDDGVYPLKKGVGAPTIRLRYYQTDFNEYSYIDNETYVAYDSVGLYYLLLTPSEANSYLTTEKYTCQYYTANGAGYKPASKTIQIPGLKQLLTKQKIAGPSAALKEYIETADGYGLIPDKLKGKYQTSITREEFCELTMRLLEVAYDGDIIKNNSGKNSFTDTKNNSVIAAGNLGVVSNGGSFKPGGALTREYAAFMLANAARVVGHDTTGSTVIKFTDRSKIASWAQTKVDFVCENGIMSGKTTFDPQGKITREQAIVSILKLFEL